MSEYELDLCYRIMAYSYQSSKVDMTPTQIKKLLRLFFDDGVIEAAVNHIKAGTRPK